MAGEYPMALNIFCHHPLISAAKGAPVTSQLMDPIVSTAGVVLIPQGLLYVVKEETTIKRDHARQPHGLVGIRPRSIVVPETRRRGDASMARFARFARKTSIRDLVSMLS